MLRAGRLARTFSQVAERQSEGGSDQEQSLESLEIIEKLTDLELAAVMVFARELVCAMLVSPRLVKNPSPGTDEVGPDDIDLADFWFLWNHAMTGFFGLSVPVGHGDTATEVEVSDLSNFREESGLSGNSDDGAEVRSDTEQSAGD
jgi:hypothetical protein